MNKLITYLVVGLTATGCASEVPIPATHTISYQKKLKAAHHWDVIAADIASQTKLLMDKDNDLQQRPIYVLPATTETPFNKAFHNFLITQLVRHGVTVSEIRDGALQVKYETQTIHHSSGRVAYRLGTFTALVAGILVGRNILKWDSTAQTGAALGAGAGLDVGLGYDTSLSQTEFLVTTSMTDKGLYRLRKSDVYYIEDKDGALYEQVNEGKEIKEMKEWKVTG